MSFTESVRHVLSHYATFAGRAPRSEYWWFYLFTVLVGIATSAVDTGVEAALDLGWSPIGTVAGLALLVPGLAVAVRRLHDSDLSGLWMLGPALLSVAAGAIAFVSLFVALAGALGGDDRLGVGGLVVAGTAGLALLAATVWWIVLMVRPSTPGPNRYDVAPDGWG